MTTLERAALVLAAARVTMRVRRVLRARGFSAALDVVAGTGPRASGRVPVDMVVRAVDLVGRGMPGRDTCLVRSLVIACLLAGRGGGAELVIGVRGRRGVPASSMSAHAWIRLSDGRLIGSAEGFEPMLSWSHPVA